MCPLPDLGLSVNPQIPAVHGMHTWQHCVMPEEGRIKGQSRNACRADWSKPSLSLFRLPLHRLYRMPNLACAAASVLRRPAAPAQATAAGSRASQACGTLTCARASDAGPAGARAQGCQAAAGIVGESTGTQHQAVGLAERRAQPLQVAAREAVYLLNPSGDLPATQAAFEAWFALQPGWQARPCFFRGMVSGSMLVLLRARLTSETVLIMIWSCMSFSKC